MSKKYKPLREYKTLQEQIEWSVNVGKILQRWARKAEIKRIGKMKLNKYQEECKKTAVYPAMGKNYSYPALGLVGEAGEVAEKIKKIIRDQDGKLTHENRVEIGKELGDVLWYVAIMADEMGLTLEEVAEGNLKKLMSRKERGVLGGSGDNR